MDNFRYSAPIIQTNMYRIDDDDCDNEQETEELKTNQKKPVFRTARGGFVGE